MSLAAQRRQETEALQEVLGGEEKKLAVRKGQIELELKDIQPVIEEAKGAVSGIKKDNLNEIRALRMPPPAIRHVLAGVLTLMKQQDLSWENMRSFLAKPSVKDEIMNFDAGLIDPTTRKKCVALVEKNADSFEQDRIKRVNVAAAPLAQWVKATIKYSEVLLSIAPLRKEFRESNEKLESARARLITCETELAELDAEVARLRAEFQVMTNEAANLKDALEKTVATLAAAQSLLGKLSGEQGRWEEQVGSLGESLKVLPKHALIAAGFNTYLAGYAEDLRRKKCGEWMKKCGVTDFNFMMFMSTESQFLQWKAEGLPSDQLSMQNALCMFNSVQTPFLIDPNSTAVSWLKTNMTAEDKKQACDIVLMQEARFVTTLELAIRFGKALIIQELDGVAPILYPIIRKDCFKQGARQVVCVGEKTIDYNEDFKLFLVTRDSAPDIPAVAKAMITEINFTVTRSGLEGQLLGLTLNNERPELEQQKSDLLAKEDGLKIQLADLEKSLLEELASSEGNILENKALIESLDQTKTQSTEISVALEGSKQVQNDLDRQREIYRPIAKTGSNLFFLISQLAAVNNMYMFCLPSFNRLFCLNLQTDTAGASDEERIGSLSDDLVLAVFHYVSRSLFKADRLMFGLHMIHCMKPGLFQPNEWQFFTGELVTDGDTSSRDIPQWATSDRHKAAGSLATTFPDLVQKLNLHDGGLWGEWATSMRCEECFPSSLRDSISPFQQLMVLSVFRPDRFLTAINNYVCQTLGVQSMSPPPLNYASLVEETSADEPILFIATAGADPTAELEDFAIKTVGKDSFKQLALGSGQTEAALELVKDAAETGGWVCLKNLHLVTAWLPQLEKSLKSINPKPSFRLWLTTEPHPNFPVILLQQSLKITYESPPGVKANMLRTFDSWDDAFFSQGTVARSQCLFALAWFHAIIEERRNYIPQGFTKFYEFSFADLRSGADIISAIFASNTKTGNSKLPWTTIWGLLEFAVYGGRIDNEQDVRVLVTYLHKYFTSNSLSEGSSAPKLALAPHFELVSSTNRNDFIRIVQNMPDADNPALFSLPDNIEGSLQANTSNILLGQVRKLAVSSSLSSKFNRELWKSQLTPFIQLWDKLNANDAVSKPPLEITKSVTDLGPTDGFIHLECGKVHSLVLMINKVMKGLSDLLYGTGLLNSDLQNDGTILISGETPWRWARNWYGPEDPASWLKELCARRVKLDKWVQLINAGKLLRAPLNLGELLRPRVFINALRQQTARETKKPIDAMKLTAAFDSSLLTGMKVQVDGLRIQGATFKGGSLGALQADSPSTQELPSVWFSFIKEDEPEPYGSSTLLVPLYYAASREEFIAEIKVPLSGDSEQAILNGVGIFLTDI